MTLSPSLSRPLTILLCLLAGLAAALAHPPFGIIVGILAYGGLMLLAERAASLKSAFWRGWLAGAAYFSLSCWWVAEAFLVDAKTFGWMAPFAVFFLAGGLALFWGLAMTAYRALTPRGPWRILVFAGVLSAFEWVRGHIFTGFPWNLPGTSWEAGGHVSQSARLFGAYGLTWLTLAIACAPALLIEDRRQRKTWLAVGSAGLCLAALYTFGAIRLGTTPLPGAPLAVRVVQPNVPQAARYDPALYRDIVERYLTLTARPPAKGEAWPRLIVWPEGALPESLDAYLSPGHPVRTAIARTLAPGQTLIVGGWRSEGERSYNSLVALERDGQDIRIAAVYDKHHLVPFGEYVPRPFRAVGLQQLVPLAPFTPGPKPQPIDIGALRVQPLICYEALFPGYVARGARLSGQDAQVVVNISNDSWFGQTSGPWQHLNQARYRAIEEALPMIRATPTGVSSVIDKFGRISAHDLLRLGEGGVIDSQVDVTAPKDVPELNAVHLTRAYTLLRQWGFLGMLCLSGLTSIYFYARDRRKCVT